MRLGSSGVSLAALARLHDLLVEQGLRRSSHDGRNVIGERRLENHPYRVHSCRHTHELIGPATAEGGDESAFIAATGYVGITTSIRGVRRDKSVSHSYRGSEISNTTPGDTIRCRPATPSSPRVIRRGSLTPQNRATSRAWRADRRRTLAPNNRKASCSCGIARTGRARSCFRPPRGRSWTGCPEKVHGFFLRVGGTWTICRISQVSGGMCARKPVCVMSGRTISGTLVHHNILSHYYHCVYLATGSIRNHIVTGFDLYRVATCRVTRRHFPLFSNHPKMFGTLTPSRPPPPTSLSTASRPVPVIRQENQAE